MKTTRNVLIIIAAVCVAMGIVISAGAFAASGLNFLHWSDHNKYEEKTYYVSEDFEKVEITSVDADISIIPVDGAEARVECLSSERVTYSVEVENNILKIERHDDTKWWENIGFFINVPSFTVKVYLPVKCYAALSVVSVSGDISIEAGSTFIDVKLKTVSGDIASNAVITDGFNVSTTSGGLRASNITGASVSFQTTSGDAEMSDVAAESINISSVSGDVDFASVLATESFKIKTTSGDVYFGGCDADDISVKTVSGDVEGILWTDKSFDVHTVSGDIRVPGSVSSAPMCEISTTSGDVSIKVRG